MCAECALTETRRNRVTSFSMRRLLLLFTVASSLGILPFVQGANAEAEAAARGKANRASKPQRSKGKRASPDSPKKSERPDKAEPTEAADDPVSGEPTAVASGAPPPSRGPTRLDFDDRLIQGQTNKSGAVYLYDRKELKNRSMIRERESFRAETLSTVYDL